MTAEEYKAIANRALEMAEAQGNLAKTMIDIHVARMLHLEDLVDDPERLRKYVHQYASDARDARTGGLMATVGWS